MPSYEQLSHKTRRYTLNHLVWRALGRANESLPADTEPVALVGLRSDGKRPGGLTRSPGKLARV